LKKNDDCVYLTPITIQTRQIFWTWHHLLQYGQLSMCMNHHWRK